MRWNEILEEKRVQKPDQKELIVWKERKSVKKEYFEALSVASENEFRIGDFDDLIHNFPSSKKI